MYAILINLENELDLRLDATEIASGVRQTNVLTGKSAAEWVRDVAEGIPEDPESPVFKREWDIFTETLYKWGAKVQDKLSARSFGASSAYQLGRGIAEISWALNPTADEHSVEGWLYLLGVNRCSALTEILQRLSADFQEGVSTAIVGSLKEWYNLAKTAAWPRNTDAVVLLRRQVYLWRDLLITDLTPEALINLERRSNKLRASLEP